ncbi:caspase-8, partial [Paramuricea clavata]
MAQLTQYKKFLKKIANGLTMSDVGSLKFLCHDKVDGAALDRVPNSEALELFKLFQQKRIISENNLTCLRDLLKQIQRIDLVQIIPDEFCQQSSDVEVASPYRVLLKSLADGLTTRDISQFTFLLGIEDGIAEKLTNGEKFLIYLERTGKLSENNFTDLKNMLDDDRKDLVEKIKEFSDNKAPIHISPGRDLCYSMQQPHVIIINNQTFEDETEEGNALSEREGSDIDLTNLTEFFEELNLPVEIYENLKSHQIYDAMVKANEEINKGNFSSFICFIMSHGENGKIYGSDSKYVKIKEDIIHLFKEANCPALKGKPKLFFIQACRDRTPAEENGMFRRNADPDEAHFLLGYSTAP